MSKLSSRTQQICISGQAHLKVDPLEFASKLIPYFLWVIAILFVVASVPRASFGIDSADTIFSSAATPTTFYAGSSAVELGVKFRSDVAGTITGIRFYKVAGDTSAHTGSLWSSTGTLLATGTFSGETASGWQVLNFSTPVAIAANTTYIASYHTGGSFYYSYNYFLSAGVDNAPLHALQNGTDGPNGVYVYGSGGIFPNQSYVASNYWADVMFTTSGPAGPPQTVVAYAGTPQTATVGTAFASALQARVTDASANPVSGVTVTFAAPAGGPSATFGGSSSVTAATNASGIATSPIPMANSIAGSYTVSASVTGLPSAAFSLTNTTASTGSTTIFGSTIPTTFTSGSTPVELGVKFRSDVSGTITGIRFYKVSGDTSVHTGSLWSSTGTLLATGTFSGETASGWQVLNFSTPVAITANTTYIASFHTGGAFYYSYNYFLSAGTDNAPLHALQNGVDGPNGVYVYGAGNIFPSQTYMSANYWVDVVLQVGTAPPVPAFTYTPSYPVTGSPTVFDASSSICSASPCSYSWTNISDRSLLGTGVTISFTFPLAGTKQVQLTMTDARSQVASIEHDVIVSVDTSTGKLTWSPPACGDFTHACVDLYLTNTGSHQNPSLNSNSDYRLHLPTTGPLVGGLTISGGHNVQIIGGEIDLTYPCNDSRSACHGINISRGAAAGQVYIEGIYIKNPDPNYSTDTFNTGDGIDVDDYPGVTDIVLQNVRIEGIKGCDPADPAAHADVFQPYNAGGAVLNVDHLTGTTDCQGMTLDPDYAYVTYGLLPRSGMFKNVNINVFANPKLGNGNRYVWWFTYGDSSCVSYPITLYNAYANQPDGTLADNAVWPDPANSYPSGCLGVYSGGYASWPTLSTLTGGVTTGLPPGGDYVRAGTAGIGYISPGYQ